MPPLRWDAPLRTHALVADALLRPNRDGLPSLLAGGPHRSNEPLPADAAIAAARLRAPDGLRLRLAPIVGSRGAPLMGVAASLAARAELIVASLSSAPSGPVSQACLAAGLTLAWQHGVSLYVVSKSSRSLRRVAMVLLSSPRCRLPALPVTVFVGLHDRRVLKRLPASHALPADHRSPLARTISVSDGGGITCRDTPRDTALEAAIADTARRFRYEKDDDSRNLPRPSLARPARRNRMISSTPAAPISIWVTLPSR